MAVKRTVPVRKPRAGNDKVIEQIAAKIKKAHPGKLRSEYVKSGGNMRKYVTTFQDVVAEGYLYDEYKPKMVDKAAAKVARERFQQLAKPKGRVAPKKK